MDDVLPDWLSGSAGAKPATRFEMPSVPTTPDSVSGAGITEGFDFSKGSSSDNFDVDMIFDDGEKHPTPLRREDGSYHQMAMAPRAENKPPRDIRVGLIVTAGIVVVAMVVLGLTYWLRNSDREIVEAIPQENTAADVGVELIDDDADLLIEETPSEGAEGEFAETAGETAQRDGHQGWAPSWPLKTQGSRSMRSSPANPSIPDLQPPPPHRPRSS